MNYSPKIYAKSFYESVLSSKNPDKCIKNLLLLVEKNRDQRKLRDILFSVENILSQKTKHRKVLIESAREIPDKALRGVIRPADRVEKNRQGFNGRNKDNNQRPDAI